MSCQIFDNQFSRSLANGPVYKICWNLCSCMMTDPLLSSPSQESHANGLRKPAKTAGSLLGGKTHLVFVTTKGVYSHWQGGASAVPPPSASILPSTALGHPTYLKHMPTASARRKPWSSCWRDMPCDSHSVNNYK